MVAMSGGVDSSVALLLLKKNGYDCTGAMMQLFDFGFSPSCGASNDIEDARAIADSLCVPFFVYDFSEDFKKQVILRFADAYINGSTPNPCIICNRYIKFGSLYNHVGGRSLTAAGGRKRESDVVSLRGAYERSEVQTRMWIPEQLILYLCKYVYKYSK